MATQEVLNIMQVTGKSVQDIATRYQRLHGTTDIKPLIQDAVAYSGLPVEVLNENLTIMDGQGSIDEAVEYYLLDQPRFSYR